jgi:hypothetical protein
LTKLCYSATCSHWSIYCKYSVNNVSLSHIKVIVFCNLALHFTIFCDDTVQFGRHVSATIHYVNPAKYLVLPSPWGKYIKCHKFKWISESNQKGERFFRITNNVTKYGTAGTAEQLGFIWKQRFGGNMFLCSPICTHSLKAQWKANSQLFPGYAINFAFQTCYQVRQCMLFTVRLNELILNTCHNNMHKNFMLLIPYNFVHTICWPTNSQNKIQ